ERGLGEVGEEAVVGGGGLALASDVGEGLGDLEAGVVGAAALDALVGGDGLVEALEREVGVGEAEAGVVGVGDDLAAGAVGAEEALEGARGARVVAALEVGPREGVAGGILLAVVGEALEELGEEAAGAVERGGVVRLRLLERRLGGPEERLAGARPARVLVVDLLEAARGLGVLPVLVERVA